MKKFISLFISMAMLISMAIVPASAETYGKNWEFESGVEGWTAQNSTASAENGSLVQTITTEKSNTVMVSPSNLNLDASVYKYLKLRVKNSTAKEGFFRMEALDTTETKFAGTWSNINGNKNPADGEWHEYCIDLSQFPTDWKGTIKQFRLCMSTWTTEGTIEYDYIRLSDSGDISAYDIELNLTKPTDIFLGETVDLTATVTGPATKVEYIVNGTSVATLTEAPYTLSYTPSALGEYQISAKATFAEGYVDSGNTYVYVSDRNVVENNAYIWDFDGSAEGWLANASTREVASGCLVQSVVEKKYNSFLLSPSGLAIDASKYKYIKVRVAGEYAEGGLLAIQWITAENTAWDEKWSYTDKTMSYAGAPVVNDGDFHEYVIDLSDHAGWAGTVTRFRLKVTPNVTTLAATAYVDYIRVSDTLAYGIDSSLVPTPTPEPTPAPEIATEISVINQYVNGTELADGTVVDGDATSLQAVFTISGETAFNHVAFTVSDVTAEKDVTTVSGDGATVTYGIIVDAVIEAAAVTSAVSFVE